MLQVKHNTLILITGIIWLTASVILLSRAYSWIKLLNTPQLMIGIPAACFLSIVKIYFIFRKLTFKNIERIQSNKQKTISILEFHILKDKLLIILMILIGLVLRHTPLIPKHLLFPIYLGIGLAMLYSSFLYVKFLLKKI